MKRHASTILAAFSGVLFGWMSATADNGSSWPSGAFFALGVLMFMVAMRQHDIELLRQYGLGCDEMVKTLDDLKRQELR